LWQVNLTEYTVTSVTEGIDAQATTRVSVRPVGRMANEGFVIHAQVRMAHEPPVQMLCAACFNARRIFFTSLFVCLCCRQT
jgi:hypothetical protein